MDLALTDRVYLVTGGSRGLGMATASALLAEGARVVLSGRDSDRVRSAVLALGEDHDRVVGLTADNGDPETADRLVEAAIHRWGRLDGALISVGGPPSGSALDSPLPDWEAAFESVFLGTLRVARAAAAAISGPGALALVLSSSVRSPLPNLAISNGLRPGLAMLAKTLADELAPRGIRVNSLLPGRFATERSAQLDAATPDPAAARAAVEATIPLGRYGDPDEFGSVAAFLLSPRASYVTGTALAVDGGLLRTL